MLVAENPSFSHEDLKVFQEDFTKIQVFLGDIDPVREELMDLDRKLGLPEAYGDTSTEKLWYELQSLELQNNFSPELAIVTGTLPAKRFLEILRGGYPIKDIGAGRYHGEFAHRIQWHIIMTKSKRPGTRRLELDNDVIELYKILGDVRFQRDGGTKSLWIDLFDNITPDARHPEWLTGNLAGTFPDIAEGHELQLPVLGGACHDRYDFREKNGFFKGQRPEDGSARTLVYRRRIVPGHPELLLPENAERPAEWVPWRN